MLPFFAAETGTYSTTGPVVSLSGTTPSLGTYPVRTFAAAAADTTIDFDSAHTCTVVVVKDASNFKRYEGAVWTDASPDTLSLAAATLKGVAGTISDSDAVTVYASLTPFQGSDLDSALAVGVAPYLTGYSTAGATLTASGDYVDVPLDGRIYEYTMSAATTLRVTGAPTAPVCGDAVIVITPASGYALSYTAGWYWNGTPPSIPTTGKLRVHLHTDPSGNVYAAAEALATV